MQYTIKVNETMRNGATCLAVHRHNEDGIVLAKTDGYLPYVTWRFLVSDEGSTYSGSYFATEFEAIEDYISRGGDTFKVHTI